MTTQRNTHHAVVGYVLWIFGFMGCHRFYFGRPVSGTIWFFTLGLLGIGWIIDLLLIPLMAEASDRRYPDGPVSYDISWVLLTFLGVLGLHRMYLGKWITGVIWFFTGGLFFLGYLYDLWTLNTQIAERNSSVR